MQTLIDTDNLSTEIGASPHFEGPWSSEDAARDLVNAAWPSGHDENAISQENGLADGVRDE
jgi:hypothetical protein